MPTIRYGSSFWMPTTDKVLPEVIVSPGGFGKTGGGAANAASVQDYSLSTSDYVSGPSNTTKYLYFQIIDADIPVQSSSGSVVISAVADMYLASGTSLKASKYGATATNWCNFSISNDPNDTTSTPTYTDGNGGALTGSTFQSTYWGCACAQIPTGATVAVYELQIEFTFTLPSPSSITTAPSVVTATTATILGSINPNSATSAYPVSYRFVWGTDPGALTNTVDGLSTLTGSAPIEVSTNLDSLNAGTTYYYELQSWAPGGSIINGGIMSLVTIGDTTQISKIASF